MIPVIISKSSVSQISAILKIATHIVGMLSALWDSLGTNSFVGFTDFAIIRSIYIFLINYEYLEHIGVQCTCAAMIGDANPSK